MTYSKIAIPMNGRNFLTLLKTLLAMGHESEGLPLFMNCQRTNALMVTEKFIRALSVLILVVNEKETRWR